MSDDTSAWDKGKAEARKRFGKREAKPTADTSTGSEQQPEQHTGTAAGIAEARRRFGKPTK